MTDRNSEITIVGDDDTGLIAEVTSLMFERDINIIDVDQAVRDGVFRMTMQVDTDEMTCSRETLRNDLERLGDELDVDVEIRFPGETRTKSVAVLVTKESHCLEALLEAAATGEIDADIEVVVGNHAKLEPVAAEYGVPFHDIGDEKGTPDEDELLDILEAHDIDLIALARYIRILSPSVVFRYTGRIINVHPSLLPAFPGAAAYTQALEEGVRIAGVTAHYVTSDLDQGPIITQRAYNVPDDATKSELKERGQPLEAEALLEAVRLHLNDDISITRGRTDVADDANADLGLPEEIQRLNPAEPVDEAPLTGTEPADD